MFLASNTKQPTALAMAVKEGKIIEVGDLAAMKKAAGKSYEYVDLEGKTVGPGQICRLCRTVGKSYEN